MLPNQRIPTCIDALPAEDIVTPDRSDRAGPIKVLYVMGRGRSGSTIFANVLGQHDGYFAAGEVRFLWDPVVTQGAPCACGQIVSACPVWSQVLELVGDVAVADVARWQNEVVEERNLRKLLRYPNDGSWHALESYRSVMTRVYDALTQVTGASVIVDSSKRPSYAAFVRLLEGCDLYCIQLIRDPRASAYSWGTRRHPSAFGAGREVKRRNPLDSTIRWDVLNLEAQNLLKRLPVERKMRLRYEDFVAAPRTIAEEVIAFVGWPTKSPFLSEDMVELTPGHAIAGNPSRFASGKLVIRDTGEWRTNQPPSHRFVATVVALPFLRRYGYPLRP